MLSPFEPPTEQIVRLAREGSNEEMTKLFERLAPALFGWATLKLRPFGPGSLDPEDFVQEVWWRAMESFDRFDSEQGTFRGWIFGIATHTLLNFLRRLNLRKEKGDGEIMGRSTLDRLPREATAISQRVARDEALKVAIQTIEELPEEDRSLFIAFALEGLSAVQVGELIGISSDAATKRWQRLRVTLRGRLPEEFAHLR